MRHAFLLAATLSSLLAAIPAPASQTPATAALDIATIASRASQWTVRFEANVFLIKPSAESRFVLYRDVYRTNGRNITDHTDRLQKLLTENSKRSMNEARRLADASAQYNEGSRRINVNVPTMPLAYLAPMRLAGLRVSGAAGVTEKVRGLDVVMVEFSEAARPSLVRDESGRSIPASGKYWIHPGSGAVVRAYVELAGRGYLEVDFALHETLSVWVPIAMTEVIQSVTGKAEYDRFQRVEVTTGEISK